MEELKKLIKDNYFLDDELFLDPHDHLWIHYNNLTINMFYYDDGTLYFSAHSNGDNSVNDDFVCDDNEVILYALYKYCKDAHKWGVFDNKN